MYTGTRVRARGLLRNGTLELDPSFGEAGLTTSALAQESEGSGFAQASLATPDTFGVQSTLVILLNFQDLATQPFSPATAQSVTFSQVNDFELENSFGQTSLTGIVAGFYTAAASTTRSYNSWALLADQGRGQRRHRSRCIRRVYCSANQRVRVVGIGNDGGGNPGTLSCLGQRHHSQVIAHEMGHGFGLYTTLPHV